MLPRESLDSLQAEVLGGFVKLTNIGNFPSLFRAGGLCTSLPRGPV